MFSWVSRWFGGAQLAEVTVSLPFIQLTFQPLPATQSPKIVSQISSGASISPQQSLELHVQDQNTPDHSTGYPISATAAYRYCESVDKDGRMWFQGPRWKRFEGRIVLFPGDIVWLALKTENTAGRVIHDVNIRMGNLEFIGSLPGAVIAYERGYEHNWDERTCSIHRVGRVADGMRIPHYNPHAFYSLHCFFQVPLTMKPGQHLSLVSYSKATTAAILEQHARYGRLSIDWPLE